MLWPVQIPGEPGTIRAAQPLMAELSLQNQKTAQRMPGGFLFASTSDLAPERITGIIVL
jgi:hypothetical protein